MSSIILPIMSINCANLISIFSIVLQVYIVIGTNIMYLYFIIKNIESHLNSNFKID